VERMTNMLWKHCSIIHVWRDGRGGPVFGFNEISIELGIHDTIINFTEDVRRFILN